MITKLFLKLTDYAVFRRLLWKPVYELLAKRFSVKDWSFMNYGSAPLNGGSTIELKEEDEINRYPIQLYQRTIGDIKLAECKVLEVGSGRGGGASFIEGYHSPAKMVGLDIALNAVTMATELYGKESLEFVQGTAEQLPFDDESFDVVINIESSHTYGSVPKFLSEVKRVLKNNGYFICADIRTSEAFEQFKKEIYSCEMRVLSEENISDNVRRAIELEEPIKQKRIKENIPKPMQAIFKQFAGVKGSKAHTQLQNGELLYYKFVLKKTNST
jgi:ubiquinone/menaquinone biosynthesis C-methylase UbiE